MASLDAKSQSSDIIFSDGFALVTRFNDTGQNWCSSNTALNLSCPQIGIPEQDGDRGRDARARTGQLPKIGSGEAGFDFSKISNAGLTLPANAVLGSGPTNWACTKDNLTGLIWEVKLNIQNHLRHFDHEYSWYNTNSNINGGNPGSLGTSTSCNQTLMQCNTQAFVNAVNSQNLCGFNDWRMPTPEELLSITHYGRSGSSWIDPNFFPNEPDNCYYSNRNNASDPTKAWSVCLGESSSLFDKSFSASVRLVRGTQN